VDVTVPLNGVNIPAGHNVVRVLLPEEYSSTTTTYPVLYLLHGAGDDFEAWTTKTELIDLVRGLDLVIVMPDAGGTYTGSTAEAGWYTDWRQSPSWQWETYHIERVIPHVESQYRIDPTRRAVAGLSMGGYGAMKYAARHVGLFKAAASFSGAVDIRSGEPANYVIFVLAHPYVGTPDDRVWGSQLTDEQNWKDNNPADLVQSYAGTGILLLLATGNGLPGGAHDHRFNPGPGADDAANPGGAALETGVWRLNDSFRQKLDAAAIPHTDLFYGPGVHSWPYWRDSLSWALPQILARIR
jgi:S-formylglutathione hydrolase FrmB